MTVTFCEMQNGQNLTRGLFPKKIKLSGPTDNVQCSCLRNASNSVCAAESIQDFNYESICLSDWPKYLEYVWLGRSFIACDASFFWAQIYFSNWLKVSKTRKQIVKPCILPKKRMNSTLLLRYFRWTCFRSFFGRNWRRQKDVSKLTDL